MTERTGTAFSLALFPQLFLFERMLNSDVVFVLSDRRLDNRNHTNECFLRSAAGGTRKIEIPVRRRGVPIDYAEVPECSTWFPGMQEEVRRTYAGLPLASAATELVSLLSPPFSSPWLTDYLLHPLWMTIKWLGWDKEIVRGPTERRQRYIVGSEYLLDLCHEYGCKRLIISGLKSKDRALFRSEGVTPISQQWRGSTALPGQDSILDAVARLSARDIVETLKRTH